LLARNWNCWKNSHGAKGLIAYSSNHGNCLKMSHYFAVFCSLWANRTLSADVLDDVTRPTTASTLSSLSYNQQTEINSQYQQQVVNKHNRLENYFTLNAFIYTAFWNILPWTFLIFFNFCSFKNDVTKCAKNWWNISHEGHVETRETSVLHTLAVWVVSSNGLYHTSRDDTAIVSPQTTVQPRSEQTVRTQPVHTIQTKYTLVSILLMCSSSSFISRNEHNKKHSKKSAIPSSEDVAILPKRQTPRCIL